MLKHLQTFVVFKLFITPLYHIYALYSYCDRMVSVTATELQ